MEWQDDIVEDKPEEELQEEKKPIEKVEKPIPQDEEVEGVDSVEEIPEGEEDNYGI